MAESTFNQEAKEFCDRFSAWLLEHERELHDGERCDEERANILAYIAHRIGYRREVFVVMLDRLKDYEAMHAEHHH